MHNFQKLAGVACGAAALLAFGAGPAMAASGSVNANLNPIEGNGVDGSGTAMVKVDGTTLTVTMAAMGLLADQPHAAHIHYGSDARNECPTLADDSGLCVAVLGGSPGIFSALWAGRHGDDARLRAQFTGRQRQCYQSAELDRNQAYRHWQAAPPLVPHAR